MYHNYFIPFFLGAGASFLGTGFLGAGFLGAGFLGRGGGAR